MNSSPRILTHYVPEILPVDHWSYADGATPENKALVLPPKRASLYPLISGAMAEIAFRIRPNAPRRKTADSKQRLEVRRFNSAVVRLEPEVLSVPKLVGYTTFHERPKREKTSRNSTDEDQNWGLSRLPSARWLAGAGVGIVALIILAMILLPSINAPNAPRRHTVNPQLEVASENRIEGFEALNQLLTKQQEAMQLFRAYCQAVIVDKVVPLVKCGDVLKETLRQYWRPLGISALAAPPAESTWTVFQAAGHACGLLQGILPDGSKFAAYFTNDDNRLLLDWKATSSFSTASFEQLSNNQGDASEIRGQISAADFYSAAWPEAEYQCYRLVSPDEKTAIWCYARRGSAAGNLSTALFQGGEIVQDAQTSRSITLQLERGPSEAQPNQWLIGQVLQIDAITP